MSPCSPTRPLRLALCVSAAALMSGCVVGPKFQRPAATADAGYVAPNDDTTNIGPVQTAVGEKVIADWWTLFHSPVLDQLVREAIANNLTLEAARARLAEARAAAEAEGAPLHIDATAGIKEQQINLKSLGGGAFSTPTSIGGVTLPAFPSNPKFPLYSIGGAVNYNLDVFGGLRRRRESLRASTEAAARELDAAYLTLTGQVVDQALTMADATIQIRDLRDVVASDEADLEFAKRAYAAGGAPQVQIPQIEAQLYQDRAAIPPQQQRLDAARHRMAVLLGKSPATFAATLFDERSGTLPEVLPVAVPSALMRNRPDILEAEARLHQATAEIGVATANLYPNIDLTASLNQDALTPTAIFNPTSTSWAIGAGLTAPIFHGGELHARKREAEAAAREALAQYQQTVLAAFNQVADLLQAIDHDNQAYADQTRALDAAEERVEMLRRSLVAGGATAVQVLHAERDLRRIRIALAQQGTGRYSDSAMLLLATASVPKGVAEASEKTETGSKRGR
ncbi:MAG TPA: efflux transporter outer membrane subunit [Caulobacteraceae bacterium]|nr:efflux transporter outer membrane subunit [Caulobacteraceae bacterium]